jgi:hypothetical protein
MTIMLLEFSMVRAHAMSLEIKPATAALLILMNKKVCLLIWE